jgi:hypothetical protein
VTRRAAYLPLVYLICDLLFVNLIHKLTSEQLLSPDCFLEEVPSGGAGSQNISCFRTILFIAVFKNNRNFTHLLP